MTQSIRPDWLSVPISDIADFGSGETTSVAGLSARSSASPVPVFGGNGIAGYATTATVTKPTVILGRVGQKCGAVYRNSGPARITDNALYARRFKRPVDVAFLSLALEAAHLNDVKNQNDLPLITQSILRDVKVPWPESIQEQREIAHVIADIDCLVLALARLVDKKIAIKQGVMQQLLTGRTRLPGFTREWKARKIGDFAVTKAGGTPSTAVQRYWGGAIQWMSSGEIHKKRVCEVQGRITVDGLRESAAQLLPPSTVLMALAGQGKTRGTVAVSRVELSTNQSIAGILPSDEHDSDFLYYNLDARYEELRAGSSGDGGRGGLNLTIIRNLDIFMPDRPEQTAIAGILGDADDEIDVLRARLAKARDLKAGMVQELLSGRTRLLPSENAS